MTSASQDWAENARDQQPKQVANDLAGAQRLTDFSQVLVTLIHEAHEPLAAISNYANACRRLVIDGTHDNVPLMLERIAEQTKRAGKILNRIREHVRAVDPAIEP